MISDFPLKVLTVALRAESLLKPAHIYFAHYGGQSLLRIVVDTEIENKTIENMLKNNLEFVVDITVRNGDGPSSVIHSLGYQICKALKQHEKDVKIEQLGDLFHWMQNMLGFLYAEEESNHVQWADTARKLSRSKL